MIRVTLHRSDGVPIERDLDPTEGDTETTEAPLLASRHGARNGVPAASSYNFTTDISPDFGPYLASAR